LAVISTISLSSYENIDVSGMGFRGGQGFNGILPFPNCDANGVKYPSASQVAAFKGESIATLSLNIIKGKGSPAGGGGGGLSHNSGGGGGGNAGTGGYGGFQSDTCNSILFDNRGIGGKNILYSSVLNKIFMGSGGGAGHVDDNSNLAPSPGAAGGGIIIIITEDLSLTGHSIMSNGSGASDCLGGNCNDGMGGGGGGGSVLLKINQAIDSVFIATNGGKGANMTGAIIPGGRVGPGGGGGAGMFSINSGSLPPIITYTGIGGINGVLTMDANNAWGATAGSPGINLFNLVIPIDTV